MKHVYSKTELMKMLADAGIRPSVQRLAILKYVSADKCHPTADEIYTVFTMAKFTIPDDTPCCRGLRFSAM